MFHSIFGRRINAPLALLAAQRTRELLGIEIGSVDDEDGFLLYAYGDGALPEGILQNIDPETVVQMLEILLPVTPLFNMAFRYNSGRALMMGVRKNSRQPLWLQRMRSAQMLAQVVQEKEHPLIRETRRECIQELWDAEGVKKLLSDIQSGVVKVREIYTELPSPMSLPFLWGQEAAVMYDYSPTPRKIHSVVEDALKEALRGEQEVLQAGTRELLQVQERSRLPQNEKQLHSLLMTEGDLAAGELDIPAQWLDTLAQEGRAAYLEQGLWIAAEEADQYAIALSAKRDEEQVGGNAIALSTKGNEKQMGGNAIALSAGKDDNCPQQTDTFDCIEERLRIIRRMLRYRGAADAVQTAERYGFSVETAEELLDELCKRGEAVKQAEKYYHAALYRRAQIWTMKNRREDARTCPAEAYAALLLSRTDWNAPAEESLRNILKQYAGTTFPAGYWESFLLPYWVKNYRTALLDAYLAEGELFWHMEAKGGLCFDYQAEIDWEADVANPLQELTENEQIIYQALLKRGASFMQSLNGVLGAESPYDTLMSLLEKGLVSADSFVPVRQWLDKEKTKKATARQRVNLRVKALQAGRWAVVRPLKTRAVDNSANMQPYQRITADRTENIRENENTRQAETAKLAKKTLEEKLENCFDRCLILSRETAAGCGFSWQEALSVLRVWEYTGQARRGYFVEGLSGAQFIRKKDYTTVIRKLQNPERKHVWINAADPMQCWGKVLAHREGRNFINVTGTAVGCLSGAVVAVLERQGNTLRVFDEANLRESLALFAEEYRRGRIFPTLKRIVVKKYPDTAQEALRQAGFFREMQDYVLYR